MMVKPLKGKWVLGMDLNGHNGVFDGDDVKSAVEWFKEELKDMMLGVENQYDRHCAKITITHLIDEAFADVVTQKHSNTQKETKRKER